MVDKKQKNVKNIIFKILHVICYILSICFIGICILVGVESCNNSNKQEKIDKNINKSYEMGSYYFIDSQDLSRYAYDIIIDEINNGKVVNTWYSIGDSTFSNTSMGVYLPPNGVTNQQWSVNYYRFSIGNVDSTSIYPSGYLYHLYLKQTTSDSYRYVDLVTIVDENYNFLLTYNDCFYSNSSSGRVPNLLIRNVKSDTKWATLYNKVSFEGYTETDLDNAYDEGYEVGTSEGYETGYNEGYSNGYSEGLANGGEVVDTFSKEIIINYDFDFRNLIGSIDSSTGLIYSDTDLSSYSNHLDLTGLTFECNNITYNTIRLVFMNYGDTPVIYTDYANSSNSSNSYNTLSQNTSDLFGSDYTKYYSLISVLYLNIDSDNNITDSVTVYQGYEVTNTFIQVGTGTVNTAFDYRKPHWSNQSFRKLNIIDNSNLKVNVPTFLDTFTTLEIFSEGGLVTSFNVGTLDMFSLIGSAFTSISGIFAISILPNITVGILFFLPLVVTLVVVIIRIIKKG